MEYKNILEVKSAKGRQVHAIVATLNRQDAQRDTVRSGFFPRTPIESLIVPAHKWEHVHLGKALTYEEGEQVHSILTFNGTMAASEWFEAIEHDFTHGARPLQNYSWGFKPHVDAITQTRGGRDLHARKSTGEAGIQLFEISPVLLGASVGSMTTGIKSGDWRLAMLRRLGGTRWQQW